MPAKGQRMPGLKKLEKEDHRTFCQSKISSYTSVATVCTLRVNNFEFIVNINSTMYMIVSSHCAVTTILQY